MKRLGVVVVIACLTWLAPPARSHSWYPSECCSEKDCYSLPDAAVTRLPNGYRLTEGEVVETIPDHITRNGRDDKFHVCRGSTGIRLCFFKPYSGT